MDNKKILLVNTSDVSGGAARAAYRILKGMQEEGVPVRMFVKDKQTGDATIIPLSDFISSGKIYKIYVWFRKKIKNKIQHRRWGKYPHREDVFMSDLRSEPLHGALQKTDCDILHLHWINLRFLNLKELKKINKPIVWTLHDCWPFTGICHYFYNCANYKIACGNCPFLHSDNRKDLSHKIWKKKQQIYKSLNLHIVTPSRWLAECAGTSSLFKQFPVHVIPNCIDTDVYKPLDKTNNSSSEKILFGAMNVLKDKLKGFEKLIESIRYLEKNKNCSGYELLIFGTNEALPDIPIQIPVKYLGQINTDNEMASVYNMANVVVVPSFSENLSNVIMESLSCGIPVVAFDIGGNRDLITHKTNGYLAQAFSPEDLADGICWCLENNRNNELSINARKKVIDSYTTEMIGKKYKSLYNSILSKENND